ncbi:hypothetical protein [Mycobacterium phage WXIN]|nr:hypothetical protein [Mycobacterium phage WXIN]
MPNSPELPEWDEWGQPLNDEAQAIRDREYDISMLTCPYYWAGQIEGAMCRNGCWEEPVCHTNGPFEFPPDWPAERCLAVAVDRHVHEAPPA